MGNTVGYAVAAMLAYYNMFMLITVEGTIPELLTIGQEAKELHRSSEMLLFNCFY